MLRFLKESLGHNNSKFQVSNKLVFNRFLNKFDSFTVKGTPTYVTLISFMHKTALENVNQNYNFFYVHTKGCTTIL